MVKRHSYISSQFRAVEEEEKKVIEGYFIVFNERTELWEGFYEEILPEAISDMKDVRALYNHNNDLVLGSTLNDTLKLTKDERGLKGSIEINENDQEALNAYWRIQRGDIQGCSFGFWPISEEYIEQDDGSVVARVKSLELFEVSPCVFPAYPQTEIHARKKDYITEKKRATRAKQARLLARMKGKLNGTKTSD